MFEAVDRVMKNKRGGAVPRRTQIAGQDHMLSYITPTEAEILMQLGGSGEPGPAGIPAFPPNEKDSLGNERPDGGFEGGGGGSADAGKIGSTDEDDDQAAEQNKAMADAMAAGTATGEGFDFGGTYDPDDGPYGSYGSAQKGYNDAMEITLDNPYGKMGFWTRTFGIDPSKISYADIMSVETRAGIANNQFSKFANPTNQPGKIGYNPAFETAKPGFLRSGVQKKGFNTYLGPVQEFAVKRSPMDMLAISGIGALNPAFGILAEALTDTTYGLEGLAPPDAAPLGEPQTFMGQAFQAGKQAIGDFYDAAKEAIGGLADLLSPEEAEAVAKASPAEQEQIKSELQQEQINGVTIGATPSGRTTLTMPDGRVTTMNPDGTLTGFSSASSIQAKTAQGAPTTSVQAQAAQDAQNLGLASLGTPDELSGVPMSGTVPSRTLGSLVDALPDGPPLDMQSIPGFTPDALTGSQIPGTQFSSGFGSGDGPDRPTQEETEEDDTLYSYDPKITGGFYDYGQPSTFDDRILIPTEEVLKNRFNLVI
tara:strand:+ start:971 stop:2581 length:1611 start_codon:yes stop_codon:yes gene_type:complete